MVVALAWEGVVYIGLCKQFNATGRRVRDRTRYACLNDAYGSVRGNS